MATQPPPTREPIPVIVVSEPDNDDPPFRLYALLIFVGTLLGSLIGAVADLSSAAQTVQQIGDAFNPPPTLCIAGSDTILGDELQLANNWLAEFSQDKRLTITVDAIGSGNGVRRAQEGGCVDVLAMSEAMTPEQYNGLQSAGVTIECAAEIGYDIIAFVTDISNTIPTLLQRELASMLDGRLRDWSDVRGAPGKIYILARPGSGTTAHVLSNVARYNDSDTFPLGANYVQCNSNEECLNLTLSTPGSLYWVSTAWMRTKPPQYLRVLPILRGDESPINPLTDEFALEEYPSALARPLYLYVLTTSSTSAETTQVSKDFLSYVRSLRGQQILEDSSFITYFDTTADIPITLPQGFSAGEGVRQVCKAP
ncbi:MAG: substrate-binding domain-containing protein [Armatimonadetes bacterium]|nr:substrate-binding domain-containing protein [Anaerolineae bacterium]